MLGKTLSCAIITALQLYSHVKNETCGVHVQYIGEEFILISYKLIWSFWSIYNLLWNCSEGYQLCIIGQPYLSDPEGCRLHNTQLRNLLPFLLDTVIWTQTVQRGEFNLVLTTNLNISFSLIKNNQCAFSTSGKSLPNVKRQKPEHSLIVYLTWIWYICTVLFYSVHSVQGHEHSFPLCVHHVCQEQGITAGVQHKNKKEQALQYNTASNSMSHLCPQLHFLFNTGMPFSPYTCNV